MMSKRASKHVVATCPYCARTLGGSRRPVGRVHALPDGWAVSRWGEPDPLVSGLADKGQGFLVLFALKHRWRTVSVRFRRRPGERVRVELDPPPWGEDPHASPVPVVPLAPWLRARRPR